MLHVQEKKEMGVLFFRDGSGVQGCLKISSCIILNASVDSWFLPHSNLCLFYHVIIVSHERASNKYWEIADGNKNFHWNCRL